MGDHVYSLTELVGSSVASIEDAIQNAVATASRASGKAEWFQVTEIRGHIVDGAVAHYQVVLKIGARIEEEAAASVPHRSAEVEVLADRAKKKGKAR